MLIKQVAPKLGPERRPSPLGIETVLDTALIDQTKHGIKEGKRSKQEMGLQIVLNNKLTPFEDMTIVNHLRLFSSYMHKPQNVDVDWELILDQKINLFFTIRLNLHLIYDDDIMFPVFDSNGDAILLPGGDEKKIAKEVRSALD